MSTPDDAPDVINIGLRNDQIMQRYLVRRIFKESEFEIKEVDGDKIVGFITGFDDRCIQVSTTPQLATEEPVSVLIYWPIRRIRETGRRLDDLEGEYRTKIRSYSHALRAKCQQYLTAKAPSQQRNRQRHLEVAPDPTSPVFSEA